jgi:hypothetical protein
MARYKQLFGFPYYDCAAGRHTSIVAIWMLLLELWLRGETLLCPQDIQHFPQDLSLF